VNAPEVRGVFQKVLTCSIGVDTVSHVHICRVGPDQVSRCAGTIAGLISEFRRHHQETNATVTIGVE